MKYLAIMMGAAASLVAAWGDVHAEDLAPFAGRSVAVGEMSGIAYYRPTRGRLRGCDNAGRRSGGSSRSVRRDAQPRSSDWDLPAPGMSGEEPTSITITRNGDHLSVDDGSAHAHGALVAADPAPPRERTGVMSLAGYCPPFGRASLALLALLTSGAAGARRG